MHPAHVHKKTGIPVIAVMRKLPNLLLIKQTLMKLSMESKWKLMQKAGSIEKIHNLFMQRKGITKEKAKAVLELTCTRSHIPEPLRMAHLIASGIVLGESRGKA